MENKRNFYAEYNEYYKNIKKQEGILKVVVTNGVIPPFPYLPYTERVINKSEIEKILTISNNNETFFIASNKFKNSNTNNQAQDDNLSNYNQVGAVCKMECVTTLEEGISYICNVLYFAKITEVITLDNSQMVRVVPLEYFNSDKETIPLLISKIKGNFDTCVKLMHRKVNPDLITYVLSVNDPFTLICLVASTLNFTADELYKLMCETNLEEALIYLRVISTKLVSVELLEKNIDDRIREENTKHHHEALIKEKIRMLSEQVGEGNEFNELANKIKQLNMPTSAQDYALKQLEKLKKTPSMSADYSILRSYLETVVELPWSVSTEDNSSIEHAKQVLNNEHFGLEKVKTRILEYLAVLKLNNKVSGQILCLVGPPGVGKTSIAKSVANALNRKFVKLTLGGVHDESEIRGHRKTYVGAMIGKIMHSLKLAEVNNPVFLLDEIDKLGHGNHGDPASALLEVLDPQQNSSFRDNYLEIPFDLSKVVFIATANYVEQIPAPLRDRMEIININSYLPNEKLQIAKNYLIPKQLKENGLSEGDLAISDEVIYKLINNYTYEAGVRGLERLFSKLCRKLAVKKVENKNVKLPWRVTEKMLPTLLDEPPVIMHGTRDKSEVGVSYGLGWSPNGGSILILEGIAVKGKGSLVVTGNLKQVMKESCQIAYTVAKKFAMLKGNKLIDYSKNDLHINVCEGAIQKDGPSAGTVLALVIYSVLTNQKISNQFAMTGEISLTGQIYAIGGLREKLYACVQNNIKNVIVPLENKKDIDFVPKDITSKLNIFYVSNFKEVIDLTIIGG